MKLQFPQGMQSFLSITGAVFAPDANGQVDIGTIPPQEFLGAGFTPVPVDDPSCTTATRPATPVPGQMSFDKTLNSGKGLPIWWAADGSGWINAAGAGV